MCLLRENTEKRSRRAPSTVVSPALKINITTLVVAVLLLL